MPLQNLSDNPDGPLDPGRIKDELFRAEEALGKNQLLWFIEKYFAERRSIIRAGEYIPLWHELQKEAVIRINRQKIDAAIAREQARNDDAILEEQVWNRIKILRNVLTQLDQPLPEEVLENLPDDVKVELTSSVIEKIFEQIFQNNPPVQSNPNLQVSSGSGHSQRFIDADEF